MTDEKKPPQGAGNAMLYAGVDVLADRLELGIYDLQAETRQVAAFTLWVDPSQDEAWRLLHALLCAYPGLQAVGVDSGGHHTGQVYRFALASKQPESGAAHEVFATKTRSTCGGDQKLSSTLVDVQGRGRVLEEQIRVLLIAGGCEAATPDVLRYSRAVHEWMHSIGCSNPSMDLSPGNQSLAFARVQSLLAEAQLKEGAATLTTCPARRALLQAESSLLVLRAKETANRQTT